MKKKQQHNSFGSVLYLVFIIVLYGCGKSTSERPHDYAVVMGNSRLISKSDTGCLIKIKYFVNSYYFSKQLLDPSYFSVGPNTGYLLLPDGSDFVYTYTEVSRRKITNQPKTFSFLLLMDKSINSVTSSYSEGPLKEFENSFYKYFKTKSGYEINLGVFGTGNPDFNNLKIFRNEFADNISKIGYDTIAYLFDFSKNKGTPNMAYALDQSINYMRVNAKYENKEIFVFTDPNSAITDTSDLNAVIAKANLFNIRISIYNTLYPDATRYSNLLLCNRTNGFYFSDLTSEFTLESFGLTIPGLFEMSTDGNYYESTLQLTSDTTFKKLNWAITNIEFEFPDFGHLVENVLYEN